MPTLSINATQLEGFTKAVIHRYLLAPELKSREKSKLVARIATRIVQGEVCTVLLASDIGDGKWDYLIHGPNRFLVRGKGNTPEAFAEDDERLTFFPKAGYARPARLDTQTRGSPGSSCSITLERDEHYRYTLGGHGLQLVASDSTQVELRNTTCTLKVSAPEFWGFVFEAEDLKAEISVSHAAHLLGLSILTLSRRIGEERLPAVRANTSHPGLTQAGLEEYLVYRQLYPQGCISPGQYERWCRWQAEWQQHYTPCRRVSPS